MITGRQFPNWSTDSPEASRTPYNRFIRKTPMPTTFADYAAQQDARNTIELNVRKWSLMLCDALQQDYQKRYYGYRAGLPGADTNKFYIESGRKYHKIIMDANGSRSVHAFIDRKSGEVYKSASWKAPAKGVRYDLRLIEQREWLLENATWHGSYLYKR